MPSNPSGEVTTVVIKMEPGWVYVKIADPKPESDRIEFFLRRTIDDWFDAHSTFLVWEFSLRVSEETRRIKKCRSTQKNFGTSV